MLFHGYAFHCLIYQIHQNWKDVKWQMWFLLTSIESNMDIMWQNEVLSKRGTAKKLLATSIKKKKIQTFWTHTEKERFWKFNTLKVHNFLNLKKMDEGTSITTTKLVKQLLVKAIIERKLYRDMIFSHPEWTWHLEKSWSSCIPC